MTNILDLIQVSKKDLGKSEMTSGNKYEITMVYMGKQIVFYFHDNYKNASDEIDFLYALMTDAMSYRDFSNIHDFAKEFGYADEWENKDLLLKVFDDCKKQFEKYNKLFNKQEQQEIENLLADY